MADFALQLLKLTPVDQSIVMSPLSLMAALSALEVGASGVTKNQIVDALNRTSDSDVPELIRQLTVADGVLLAVATKFYLSNSTNLHEEYNSKVSKDFDVTAESLDFTNQALTIETVNSYVSETTRGMLPKLLSDDFYAPEMRAFLINAVYFKGQWASCFSPNATQNDVFHGIEGDREESFMTKYQMRSCRYAKTDGVQTLKLPYKDENYEFVIFLPSEMSPFAKFREEITGDRIKEFLTQAETTTAGVNVTIPKFKLTSTPAMKNMLMNLGITELFNGTTCDLHAISADQIYVDDVIHKAVVEVDEEGCEVPRIERHFFTLRNVFPVFDANRPFIYGIFHGQEPILIGQYC